MESKRIAIGKLTPNKGQIEGLPANPRQWTQTDLDRIARSLRETPELFEMRPCIVYPHGDKFVILGGNLRYTGAKANKDKDVPCIVMPEDTPVEKLKEIVVKDNSSFGAWDYDALANEWDDLPLQDWGVPAWKEDTAPATPEVKEDDFNEDAEVETRCNPGDIWQLGDHRLMCGDSTDGGNVALLMDGAKATLTLTDPPYRLMTEGGGILKTANSMKQIHENKVDSFEPLKLQIYSDTNIYTHNKPLIKEYILLAERENLPYDLAIYKKQGLPNYKGHLMTDIEYIAIIGNQDPKKGYDLEMYSKLFSGGKDSENELSYSKPIKLCEKFICLYSDKGDSVLDLFGGSGTTLIAAEQLGRRCYMMELDPHYCDVIISRWETFTGKTAQLITPGDKVS